jgi:hypothetical protein
MKKKTKRTAMGGTITSEHAHWLSKYGPGVVLSLDNNALACAVDLFLASQGFVVSGPRTICYYDRIGRAFGPQVDAEVHVDPSGFVIARGKRWDGQGGRS